MVQIRQPWSEKQSGLTKSVSLNKPKKSVMVLWREPSSILKITPASSTVVAMFSPRWPPASVSCRTRSKPDVHLGRGFSARGSRSARSGGAPTFRSRALSTISGCLTRRSRLPGRETGLDHIRNPETTCTQFENNYFVEM